MRSRASGAGLASDRSPVAAERNGSTRRLKSRPPIVVRPLFVSQDSAFALLGITARKFLELVAPRCERVTRLGKSVLVSVDEAERVVGSMAVDSGDGEPVERDDDQPQSVDQVLAALGKELA